MDELKIDSTWIDPVPKVLLIAGPCSAETEEQVLETAGKIAPLGHLSFFRSGLWKPRTRPGGFEGVGAQGIPWLKKVKREFGFKVITEVGSREHVKICLDAGLDAVWIGARTTVNPYLIDEIAAALRGTDIPVFVKNPVSPDLELWIGALERLNRAGIKKLVGVHRGFTTIDSAPYRNSPLWEIPQKLVARFPSLPVLCDPSHMSGKSYLVPEVAVQSMRQQIFSGYMIEVHCDPPRSFSDVEQQLTPKEYGDLRKTLEF